MEPIELSSTTHLSAFFLLLANVRNVYASNDEAKYLIDDDGIRAFMHHCEDRIGSGYFRTPRETIMPFVDLLAVLDQNPTADLAALIGKVEIPQEANPDLAPLDEDPEEPVSDVPGGSPVPAAADAAPVGGGTSDVGGSDDGLTAFKL